jgi:CspA family cold shock protein
MEMPMKTGFVRFYNRMKGWGFIVPDDLSDDIFLHYSGLVGCKFLREGQRVSYVVGEWNGKPVARNIEVIEDLPAGTDSNRLTQADALALLGGGGPAPKAAARK